ncbi:hypothetical protein [Paucibacter sp. DJ2R-2]|uniref:hypothetical protein n=1 Tax=Paucibacter sp. DJ2R-2 TaxID=2893558 RepID=UPI0021E4D7DB|nr:hypothetical protein [Paucibacter sp. DJ2R-2]MCV2419094.1 hypothetical protein [Paucibacter sp. DJ4R-1]MCV2437951.1 hypothetical protein [Paucibacter sp. DJ2R-2]
MERFLVKRAGQGHDQQLLVLLCSSRAGCAQFEQDSALGGSPVSVKELSFPMQSI